MAIGKTRGDRVFDVINTILLSLLALSFIYVLIFVLSASLSSPTAVYSGKVILWPVDWTLEGYERVFRESKVWVGYRNTAIYTLIGTLISVALTTTAAYALSRKDLPGRGIITGLLVFTMFFGGGLIPTYLIVKDLGLLDSMWAVILPGCVSMSNIIIAKTFFSSSIPIELLEAAQLDGCSNRKYFFNIVIPLSQAIIAVLCLYYAVGYWNQYFSAMIYLKDREKYTLQLILREILIEAQASEAMTDDLEAAQLQEVSEVLKYALIIVASVPMLILYPFIQKYFVKGVMIGSLKG